MAQCSASAALRHVHVRHSHFSPSSIGHALAATALGGESTLAAAPPSSSASVAAASARWLRLRRGIAPTVTGQCYRATTSTLVSTMTPRAAFLAIDPSALAPRPATGPAVAADRPDRGKLDSIDLNVDLLHTK
jgi:hypothetical protein